jgi:phage shock protein B
MAVAEVAVVLSLAVVAPIALIGHYLTKARAARGLTPEDEKLLGDLWESTKRMEERVRNLERILDADHPSWRGRS